MNASTNLTDQFLIAMPTLQDPNFVRTVSYICQHSDEGAMGIVINRPLDVRLHEVLEHMEIEISAHSRVNIPVFLGGPVQPERGFVLHEPPGHWESSLQITNRLAITTSRDILRAIAQGEGPDRMLIALGYAGWSAGQLEHEMAENAWLSGPATPTVLFNTEVEERWIAAAAALGIDLTLLSAETGHG